jgi:hypothetical protein
MKLLKYLVLGLIDPFTGERFTFVPSPMTSLHLRIAVGQIIDEHAALPLERGVRGEVAHGLDHDLGAAQSEEALAVIRVERQRVDRIQTLPLDLPAAKRKKTQKG